MTGNTKDIKHMHDGHRGRLLNLVSKAGIDNVSEVQALEFVLTYIFPRGDTNPLAHLLLNKFGSFDKVLDADELDLIDVPGIGERAAKYIKMIPEIFHLYSSCKISKKESLSNFTKIYDFCEELLRMKNTEELYIVGLNAKFELNGYRRLAKGSINMVGISPDQINKFLISSKPMFVFLTHNHPGGSAVASKPDIEATENMKEFFKYNNIQLVDHYIVGVDGIYSINERKLKREFVPILD